MNSETGPLASRGEAPEEISLKPGGPRESQNEEKVAWLYQETQRPIAFEEVLGQTPHMREILKVIESVSKSDAPTILLEGESGTGKSLIARLIHAKSSRRKYPFVEINCASLPETLIESELFGHERGAFTDAHQMKRGLFEAARGGSVLLDEVSEMSIATQAKLLQVIETHNFRRLGGLEDIGTNVRVIAATNANLKQAVQKRAFREDLYFRLQLIPLTLPPLRERAEDILLIARYFVQKFNADYKKNILGLSPEVESALKNYSWPGNIRELRNVIERIAILEDTPLVELQHLPPEVMACHTFPQPVYELPSQGVNLEEVEKHFILQALQKSQGNQSRAAKLLGITRHTLRYRMEKFGVV